MHYKYFYCDLKDGWASNSSGGHHGSRGHLCPSQQSIHYHQHRHEEQCPHYNEEFKYKEAPSWELANDEIPLDILQKRNRQNIGQFSGCVNEPMHCNRFSSTRKCNCSEFRITKNSLESLDILDTH